jgi:23S rRNA (cytosine1962-C5)-methyltransferase
MTNQKSFKIPLSKILKAPKVQVIKMSFLDIVIDHIRFPIKNSEQAQRLFHGRGHAYDGLHHVTIDWLPPVVLITLFTPENALSIETLADQLQLKLPNCKTIQLQHRYELQGPIDVIRGEEINQLVIEENKLKYQIQLGKSRNTGLFLDMSNGRKWTQEHSKGKRVLNLFSYTCGFSIASIAGGASCVVNIDMSSAALSVGRENHRLNQHDLSKVKFEKLNIFKSFGRLKKRGPFDLLICDPPTLQKGSVDIIRDYPKIMRRLGEFMAPNATLMLCLNAPELDRDFLIENMKLHAPNYHFTEEIKPPEVYIDAQDKGLKVLAFNS